MSNLNQSLLELQASHFAAYAAYCQGLVEGDHEAWSEASARRYVMAAPPRKRRTSITRALRLAKREGVEVTIDRERGLITFRDAGQAPDDSPNPWDVSHA